MNINIGNRSLSQASLADALISSEKVIEHFRNQGRPLDSAEVVQIITNPKFAREAIQSGQITKKERNALVRQARENLAKRENKSELKGVGFYDNPDLTVDAALQNDIDAVLEKRKTDSQRYRAQEDYLTREPTTPLITGGVKDADVLVKEARQKIKEKPKDIGAYGEGGATRILREPAGLYEGGDYRDIAVAPQGSVRNRGLIGGIQGALSADSSAREELERMRSLSRKMIEADEARITPAGRGLRQLNNLLEAKRREEVALKGPLTSGTYPLTLKEVITQAIPVQGPTGPITFGGPAGYTDPAQTRLLGNEQDLINRELGLRTRAQQAAMTDAAYLSAYGGMGAQQFIDNYAMPGEFSKQMPNIDITLETTNLVNKLRERGDLGFDVVGSGVTNVRSASELDTIISRLRQAAAEDKLRTKGNKKRTIRLDKPTNEGRSPKRNLVADQEAFGVLELLNELDYGEGEKRKLAMALDVMQQARMNKVNASSKQAYFTRRPDARLDVGGRLQGPVDNRQGQMIFDSAEAIDGRFVSIPLQQAERKFAVGGDDASIGALKGQGNAQTQAALSGRVYKGRDRDAIVANAIERAITARGKAIAQNVPDRGRSEFEDKMSDMERSIGITERTQGRADADLRRRAQAASEIIATLPPVGRRSNFPRR